MRVGAPLIELGIEATLLPHAPYEGCSRSVDHGIGSLNLVKALVLAYGGISGFCQVLVEND